MWKGSITFPKVENGVVFVRRVELIDIRGVVDEVFTATATAEEVFDVRPHREWNFGHIH